MAEHDRMNKRSDKKMNKRKRTNNDWLHALFYDDDDNKNENEDIHWDHDKNTEGTKVTWCDI